MCVQEVLALSRQQIKKSIKAKDCYGPVLEQVKQHNALMAKNHQENKADPPPPGDETFGVNAGAVVISHIQNTKKENNITNSALTISQKKIPSMAKPKWHAPWKLYRVISGHLGWVRCCAIEPGNEWFATGSADRVIKVSLFFL